MSVLRAIKNFFVVSLKPNEMEERFRIETLSHDKTQITIVMIVTLCIVLGFLVLDISIWQSKDVHPSWIPGRIVALTVSFIAIGIIHQKSNVKLVDRVTFMWELVILLHMLIINLTRPRDYVSVIVWDILVINGIYYIVPLPFQYKILTAFLLTGTSGAIMVINRVQLVNPYDRIAVLAAYFISNVYGIFVSMRYDRSHRRNYILLAEEKKLVGKISERTRELEKTQDELKLLAMTDPLTGISNRRHFMSQISKEFERSKRYDEPFSIIVFDIDNFKEINDTYGHEAGDEVLRSFTRHCLTKLRSIDQFARFGGDEFIALLVQTGQYKAKEIAKRLIATIDGLDIQVEKGSINFTVSIGLTTTDNFSSVEDLIKRADEALYAAKNEGRNQIAIL